MFVPTANQAPNQGQLKPIKEKPPQDNKGPANNKQLIPFPGWQNKDIVDL